MKNIFCKISALMLAMCTLTSCGDVNSTDNTMDFPAHTPEYTVLETDLSSDSSALIKHTADIKLVLDDKTDAGKKDSTKEVTVGNEKITGKYFKTSVSPYYNRTADIYKSTSGSVQAQFSVDPATNKLVGYSVYDTEYAAKVEGKNELTKEECIEIAENYLKQHVSDIENYRITCEYSPLEIYKGRYAVYFTRYINDIPTIDSAYIYVSVYGDIMRFDFGNLGDMKDTAALNPHNIADIDKNVEEKRNEVYGGLINSEEYEVSFSQSKKLVRLENGKYALQYTVNANISYTNKDMHFADTSSFIVYLE